MNNPSRLVSQREALKALICTEPGEVDDLQAKLKRLVRSTASALGVARVGVWRLNTERSALHCELQFQDSAPQFTSGAVLKRADFPDYFSALLTAELIDADSAQEDPRTRCFKEIYLEPLGITSMLDAPIHLKGDLEGVLCCEHTGPQRTWREDEKTFLLALANLVSLALETWERRLAEQTLEESRNHYEAVVNNLPVAVCRWRPDFTITYANRKYRDLFSGGAEVVGERWLDLLPMEERAELQISVEQLLKEPKQRVSEHQTQAHDGGNHWITWFEVPIFDDLGELREFQSLGLDITERKRLEAQFQQAQKMESVGRLAGGIAHDFNNMLGVILGNVQLALEHLASDSPVLSELEEIESAAQRSAALTRQLLAFARQQTIKPQILDLNEAITQTLKMLKRLVGEGVTLRWQPATNLWPIRLDPSQLDQILANLVVNARDALNRKGTITIATSKVVLDEDFCKEHLGSIPGEYVKLALKDHGCGMDEETRAKAFEPFFTTKTPGEGTGLGLAMVYGIVKQNLGYVQLESTPGRGTTVSIFLPRQTQTAGTSTKDQDPTISADFRGEETVLILEDEPALLDLNRRLLERQGYRTLTARDSLEALEISKRYPGTIHLILSDVILPGMSGPEVSRRLSRERPDMKTLFVSGYPAAELAHHGGLVPEVNFLSKPFSSSDLARKVREALDT